MASLLKQAKCQEKVPSRQSPQAQQALYRFLSFLLNVCTQSLPSGFIAVFDSDITTLAPAGSIPGLHRSDGWMMRIAPSAMAGNLPSLEKHGEIPQDEFLQTILVWNVRWSNPWVEKGFYLILIMGQSQGRNSVLARALSWSFQDVSSSKHCKLEVVGMSVTWRVCIFC